jgi:hypothetical protein
MPNSHADERIPDMRTPLESPKRPLYCSGTYGLRVLGSTSQAAWLTHLFRRIDLARARLYIFKN